MTGLATPGFLTGGGVCSSDRVVAATGVVVADFGGFWATACGSLYFLRMGLMRKSFCIVKLAGLICSNSARRLSQRPGSAL